MSHEHERPHARTREQAFTLVEIIVVLVIMAILGAIAATMFRGASSATRSKEAIAAGTAYAQAISQYQADHANRNPTSPTGTNTTAVRKGPLNLLGKQYLAAIPDGVTAGRTGVSFQANCATGKAQVPGASKQSSWVSFCPEAEPNFGIRVATRKNPSSSWTDASARVCWMGRTAKTPAC